MSKIKILSILPVIITLLCTLPLFSSGKEEEEMDYRTLMRDFVINISRYARTTNPSFIVIPQNGNELLCFTDWDPDGEPALEYINAIDGVGREDLFFGYTGDNIATPDEEKAYMLSYMVLADRIGLKALVIDYCSSKEKMDYSYSQNESYGFISFAADSRGLDTIPAYPVFNENNLDINSLQDARNFLFLINPGRYSRKEDFLAAIGETNYDIVIVDLYFTDEEILTADDILSLKRKPT
jgi:cysteinyl-tRNA synthetase